MNERRKLLTTAEDNATGRSIVDGHEAVDLGLPSGTLWATCNVGAERETDGGGYYKYLPSNTPIWGGRQWRIPKRADFEELIANTNHYFLGAVAKFTSKTDSSKYIFIACCGYMLDGSDDLYETNRGLYWSCSAKDSTYGYALNCNRYTNTIDMSHPSRVWKCQVRPVHDAI